MRPAALALSLLVATSALAAELAGVTFADTVEVAGKKLTLNGTGIRTKFWVNVYVAGLWVETPSRDAGALVTSDQVKRVQLVMKRDVTKEQLTNAIREGFEKNSAEKLPALQARVDAFGKMIPDLKAGGQIEITYVPGKGTTVAGSGVEAKTIEGKDFADALFAVWLGAQPADTGLKTGLLGK